LLLRAITHAANRVLYGIHVTDMPHARRNFVDAWLRIIGMKILSAARHRLLPECQRKRQALPSLQPHEQDESYHTGGKLAINMLWDVIAAKGFEKDTYFSMGSYDVRGPSKLEGTVHVNIQLIRKFMKNYFFNPPTIRI